MEQWPTGHLYMEPNLTIEGFQDNYYTAVVVATDTGKTILGRGAARRSPEDKHRPDIAQTLALGRALEAAGRRISRRANGLVRHQDYVAAEKRRLAAERAPKRRVRRKPK